MNFAIIILTFCFVCYVNTQSNCGNCFPGTSASLCGYRKPSDPILCCNDGRKYTPCTYNCVRNCNSGLRITGCGASCAPSSGPCPSNSQCLPDTAAPCNVPFVPAAGACAINLQSVECIQCQPGSPAKGGCDPNTTSCKPHTEAPCNIPFVAPENACKSNSTSVECLKCKSTSPAKGGCI